MRILFAITTANQLEYTKLMLENFPVTPTFDLDICVFDDASTDGTVDWCKNNNVEIITKKIAKGLTHSWNLAYKKFRLGNYDHFILSNNDLIIPDQAIEELIRVNSAYTIAGPLSTKKGVGHQPLQDVRMHHNLDKDEYDYENTNYIQSHILKNGKNSLKVVPHINGFIFAMNRDIVKFELDESTLFDPKNINVGNESELCERVNKNSEIAIALNSFIYHFKGVSFRDMNFDNQPIEHNIYRNLNWKEAEKIKQSLFRKLIFKLKRKFKNG